MTIEKFFESDRKLKRPHKKFLRKLRRQFFWDERCFHCNPKVVKGKVLVDSYRLDFAEWLMLMFMPEISAWLDTIEDHEDDAQEDEEA